MDTRTIATIWEFIANFDRTGNLRYLTTALAMTKALIEREGVPDDFNVEGYILIERKGKKKRRSIVRRRLRVTKDNIHAVLNFWDSSLAGWPSFEQKGAAIVAETAKLTLVRILTALGAVSNPFAEVLLKADEGEGEP